MSGPFEDWYGVNDYPELYGLPLEIDPEDAEPADDEDK
jgi:hypothetical protein